METLNILIAHRADFLAGLQVTLALCAIIWTSGLVLGTALAVACTRAQIVNRAVQIVAFILSALPLIVFLFWLHYPAQAALGVVIDPFYTAAFALSVLNIFAVADQVRTALLDFPAQYLDAAKVSGLKRQQTLRHIVLPLIVRQVLPGLLILQVMMLHATLLTSLISVDELLRAAQRVNAKIYKPVEIYTALGVFFLMICAPLYGFALWYRARYTRLLTER